MSTFDTCKLFTSSTIRKYRQTVCQRRITRKIFLTFIYKTGRRLFSVITRFFFTMKRSFFLHYTCRHWTDLRHCCSQSSSFIITALDLHGDLLYYLKQNLDPGFFVTVEHAPVFSQNTSISRSHLQNLIGSERPLKYHNFIKFKIDCFNCFKTFLKL